jgi:predicted nucleic acid-binding Zn ribbon protein
MRTMQRGQVYRCQNMGCRAEIEVKKASIEGPSNPRCCCGAEMKKAYNKPVLMMLGSDAVVAESARLGHKN